MDRNNNWQSLYEAVLLETNSVKVREKIEVVRKAINDRLEDSLHGRQFLDSEERHAIDMALRCLRLLKP
jgi:hypothetical protein